MGGALRIQPVAGTEDVEAFIRFPFRLYRDYPHWVPPLLLERHEFLDPAKNPVFEYAQIQLFLAFRGTEVVGTIAAICNNRYGEFHTEEKHIGFFGLFECIQDQEAANALLSAAAEWLGSKGMTALRGPVNFTTNDIVGLLVDGFDDDPAILMPYNPPYYEDYYLKLGLSKARDLYAYHIDSDVVPPERVARIVDRVKKNTGISIRNANLRNLKSELAFVKKIYNETLDRNWGFVPLKDYELEAAAADLKQILDPSLVLFAEYKGEPVGFSLTVPNFNEFLADTKFNGKFMRALKFVLKMKFSHPKEARLVVLGVTPEFRNKGIAPVFYYETLVRGKRHYTGGECSWIDESNEEIIKAIELMGGKRYKIYRIYSQSLTS